MKVYLPAARRPRIEMVPLIDSFFLLLAFFMSSVLTLEVVRGLPVELPKAGEAIKLPAENRLVVTILSSGALQLEGESVSVESLRERLSAHPDRSSLRVGIRADQTVPYERLVQVLAAAQEAGVGRVTLLTAPEKR